MSNEKPELAVIPRMNAPNEKVIHVLREALKDAKQGKIQCIGIAVGLVSTAPESDGGRCTETYLSSADGWYHTLATGVNGLAFRLNHERYMHGATIPPTMLSDEDE